MNITERYRFNDQAYHTDLSNPTNHRKYSTGQLKDLYGGRINTSADLLQPPLPGYRAYEDGSYEWRSWMYNNTEGRRMVTTITDGSVILDKKSAFNFQHVRTPDGKRVVKKYLHINGVRHYRTRNDHGEITTVIEHKHLTDSHGILVWEDCINNTLVPYHPIGWQEDHTAIRYDNPESRPVSDTATWLVGRINPEKKKADEEWVTTALDLGRVSSELGVKPADLPYMRYGYYHSSKKKDFIQDMRDHAATDASYAVVFARNERLIKNLLSFEYWCDWTEHDYLIREV